MEYEPDEAHYGMDLQGRRYLLSEYVEEVLAGFPSELDRDTHLVVMDDKYYLKVKLNGELILPEA